MTLSEVSIRNPVFAWMLMAGMLIFGGLAFDRMGVSQMPDVDFPVVTLSANLEGAAPEIMEADVVDPIEGALTAVQGIKSVSSSARTGSANISVEFGLDKDVNVAVQEIQSAISRIQRQLPSEMEAVAIRKSNPEAQPILWLTVSSETMGKKELMTLVRDRVQDRFATIEGVGDVTLRGYVDPSLRVWLAREKLDRHQMTATDVIATIQREHAESPGGRIENQEKELNIRTLGEAPTPQEFESITINRRGGSPNFRPIALSEVARIEDGTADVRSMSRANGKSAIGLGITKQPGANAVKVGKAVKERMKEIAAQLPTGVEMGVRFDTTQFIEEAIHELNFTLVLSALLTAVVCWFFLGSWSATLNVVLAIPTSVVGTFIVLHALGFTLNTFTLLGLSLAIGIVVDDAIMVLENIVRHGENGKDRIRAALDGSKEITLAAIAATIAIIAIFLPVAFMDGVIGKYFWQFGITLSAAVAISLLEALTLTPMRCSQFVGSSHKKKKGMSAAVEKILDTSTDYYRHSVSWVLQHPWVTLSAAALVFCSTGFLGWVIKKEFVPPQDQGRLMVRLQAPVGSSLTYTDGKVREVERVLAARPEVESYFTSVGGGGGGSQVNGGSVFLTLKPPSERKLSTQQLIPLIRADLKAVKGIRATLQDPSLSSFAAKRGFPIEFTIRGPNWDRLVELSEKMTEEMEKTGLVSDVDTNYEAGMPEVRVIPDRVKARQRGVDVAEISQTVNVMMAGAVAGKYSQGGRRYDVRVGLPPQERSTPEVIKRLQLRNDRGEILPLSEVVTLEQKPSLQSIFREDRQRAISVYANVAPGASQSDAIDAVKRVSAQVLPSGYYAAVTGSAKTFQESFSSLIFALVLGIVVSYMVLGSQFNSFIHPVTILMALPFSVSGAFLALWLGGQTLNIYSMIGLVLLMGIVKKNSILLVEFTNQVREHHKKSVRDALIEACPVRLRPIIMTSVATVAGAIPPALALGPGAESRVPMALSVIGGVCVSTLLTLFVVPCVYMLLDRFSGNRSQQRA